MTSRHDEEGFTIVEVLIAFAIVAMALGAIFAAIGGQARERIGRDLRERALGLARSHLEEICHSTDPLPSQRSGTYRDGSRWRLRVSALATSPEAGLHAVRPFVVGIEVSTRSGRPLGVLRSIKLERTQTARGDGDGGR